jgi:hypothetical protein
MLMIYQIIGILVGLLGIIVTIIRFRDSKMSLGMLMVWSVIWVIVIGISVYPESTGFFATITGIGRGLDFILILGLIGCYYLIFRIYNMIENIEEEITELVRKIAIERKDSSSNPKDNPKTESDPKNRKE